MNTFIGNSREVASISETQPMSGCLKRCRPRLVAVMRIYAQQIVDSPSLVVRLADNGRTERLGLA